MTITYTTNNSIGFQHSKQHAQNLVAVRNETKQIGFIEAYISGNKNQVEINMGSDKDVLSNPFLNDLKFIASEEFETAFSSKFTDHNSISLRRKLGEVGPVKNHTLTYMYTFTKNVLEKGNDTPERLDQVISKFIATLSEFRNTAHLAEVAVAEAL